MYYKRNGKEEEEDADDVDEIECLKEWLQLMRAWKCGIGSNEMD